MMIEFLIDTAKRNDSLTTVTGVVNAGTVRLGNVFDTICVQSSEACGNSTLVKLTVDKIVAYGQELEELPQGMTGELLLGGEAVDGLENNVILAWQADVT